MTPHPHRIALLRQKGAAARAAHQAVREAFAAGLRTRDPRAYDKLLADFRAATAAALPDIRLGRLADGETGTVGQAIAFLAADPYFFRSGYFKTAVLRRLKQTKLSGEQKAALAALILERVTMARRSNRRDYGRLAAAIDWPPLDRELAALLDNDDDGIRGRALEMLEQILSARDMPGA